MHGAYEIYRFSNVVQNKLADPLRTQIRFFPVALISTWGEVGNKVVNLFLSNAVWTENRGQIRSATAPSVNQKGSF